MRNRFDEQLNQLNVELIKLGSLCEESIACAVKALFDEKCAKMISKVTQTRMRSTILSATSRDCV